MANNVEELLTEGEEVLATAKKGWVSTIIGLIFSLFFAVLFLVYFIPMFSGYMGYLGDFGVIYVYFLYAIAIGLPISQIIAIINLCCVKFIVTNKRVFARANLLGSSQFEAPVENVVVNAQKVGWANTVMTVMVKGGKKPKKYNGVKNVEELQAAVSQAARKVEAQQIASGVEAK